MGRPINLMITAVRMNRFHLKIHSAASHRGIQGVRKGRELMQLVELGIERDVKRDAQRAM